jgi:adenylate cyclase class 2
MTEIELKAHVDNRTQLISTLNTFSTFEGMVIRDDTYYKKDGISIRIREETQSSQEADGNAGDKTYLVTYKRKELRTDATGTSIEVNDEKECEVSSPEALVAFLTDTGYTISLTKHKEVMDWNLPLAITLDASTLQKLPPQIQTLSATLELCAVPPLGDFLEIEILSPVHDETTVSMLHKVLEIMLEKTGIPQDRIEKRYYSEMLKPSKD